MAEPIDDGGPVVASFEGEIYRDRDNNKRIIADIKGGVSLRDYFAAKALASAFRFYDDGYCGNSGEKDERAVSVVAAVAYELADAMLAARKAGRS